MKQKAKNQKKKQGAMDAINSMFAGLLPQGKSLEDVVEQATNQPTADEIAEKAANLVVSKLESRAVERAQAEERGFSTSELAGELVGQMKAAGFVTRDELNKDEEGKG